MRRLFCLLGALLCLCPALAWAADGDLVDAQAGPAPGTWTQSWKLLDAAAVVDTGQWIYYGGFTTGSVEITGISGDTVTLNCTNAAGLKPANATAGTVLSTVTTNGYTSVTQPCRWIKAAVTIHGAGTVSAILTASASGGGGGGGAGGGGAVSQNTAPWTVNLVGSTNANPVEPVNAAPGSAVYGIPTWSVITDQAGHTQPTGDAAARTIHVTLDAGVTQSGTWTSRIVGNTGGVMDAAGQNAASPANSLLVGAQFNTTPTTISSGNVSPLQLDNAGNLLVNIKANAFGSGGTLMTDASTFTQALTNFTPAGCEFNTSITNLASGQGGAFSCTAARSLHTTIDNGSVTVTQSRGLTAGDANVAETASWVYGTSPSGAGIALAATSAGALVVSSPLQVTQGTPTGLQPGVLSMGAVTQTPPIYQPGQIAPLRLTVTGAVPIEVGNPSTSATDNGSVVGGESNTTVVLSKGLVFDGASWRRGSQSNSYLSAGSTNQTSVKTSPGVVYHLDCFNTSGATEYVKLYNTAGTPTAGSGTPVIRFACPANNGHVADLTEGDVADFSLGIGFTMVKLVADSDATGVGANDLVFHIWFR